jgi:non-ribosomal peptide synthase protein (TIGR01720 family)
VTGVVPLTPIQHWFWEHELSNPHHFNQAVLLETGERLDFTLLQRSVAALVNHHDALRHRFSFTGSSWQQVCLPSDEHSPCVLVDLSLTPLSKQTAAVTDKTTELQATLDLSNGPLLRVALFDLGPGQPGRLAIIIHHLVVDALGWRILLEDLETIYGQLGQATSVQLPAKTTSYKQWAERVEAYARTAEAENELDHWLSMRRDNLVPLPVDWPDGINSMASLRTFSVTLAEEKTIALLQEMPAVSQTRINDVLLTALAETFAGWTGERTLLVDLEGHGRVPDFAGVDLSRTVGWFTAIYPVLLDTEGTGDFGETLKAVKEQLHSIPRNGFGYGVLRYLGRDEVRQELKGLPDAEISFLFLGQAEPSRSGSSFRPASESSGPQRSPQANRRYLFEIVGSVNDGKLQMTWSYSANLHDAGTIENLGHSFITNLTSLIDHCLQGGESSFTLSDFAAFNWTQQDLDEIMSRISHSIAAN